MTSRPGTQAFGDDVDDANPELDHLRAADSNPVRNATVMRMVTQGLRIPKT